MLVLTRKLNENIRIGEDITVHIISVRGNIVKLGIDAPKNISVHREEIFQRILELAEKTSEDDKAA